MRGFIRCVWGIYDNTHRITARRTKIDTDIQRIKNCKFNEPFKVYVYGKDNFERVKKEGFDCILVNESPNPFDLIKHQFRHKLELLKYAMEIDGYDEIVYLDWDCVPYKKLPDNFWDVCNQRKEIQGCLQIYHKKKCMWRPIDQRKVMNGGFMYIRDKNIPRRAIEIWETMPQDSDEPAIAKLIDDKMGGWTDTEKNMKMFWDEYETPFCALWRMGSFPKELSQTKDLAFIHYV
jgi:hypothetical protein